MLNAKLPKILKFFFLLTFLMGVVGLSGAQQALELPAAPDGTTPTAAPRDVLSFDITVPPTLMAASGYDSVKYMSMGGSSITYRIKFRRIDTGETFTYKDTPAECEKACIYHSFNLTSRNVWSKLVNGKSYQVWVVAKLADGTNYAVSNKVTAIAGMAVAPKLLAPANLSVTTPTSLLWYSNYSAISFRVRIIDVATGTVVVNKTMLAQDTCYLGECMFEISPYMLKSSTKYRWFVTTIGYNGAIAQSQKRTFTTLAGSN